MKPPSEFASHAPVELVPPAMPNRRTSHATQFGECTDWEIVVDRIRTSGWRVGWMVFHDLDGSQIVCTAVRQTDGKRCVVHAENLGLAMDELRMATSVAA